MRKRAAIRRVALFAALLVGATAGCSGEKKSFERSASALNPLIKELNDGPVTELSAWPEDSFLAARVAWEPCGRVRGILTRMKSVKLDPETKGGAAAKRIVDAAGEHEANMRSCIGGSVLHESARALECSPACVMALRDLSRQVDDFAEQSRKRGVRVETLRAP